MLFDSDDLQTDQIRGDVLRQKSLEKLCMLYCIEILVILFECLAGQRKYSECISFMSRVRERQPLVPSSLTPADIAKILNRQTSLVL